MPGLRFALAAIFLLLTDWTAAEESQKRIDEQEDAIRVIRRPGVSIQATTWTGRPYIHIDKERGYKALTEQEAELLGSLPEFYTLRIESAELLDQWLAHARRIPGLKELELHPSPRARLTADQTSAILDLPQLEALELWYCELSNSDIEELTPLKNLQELRIGWGRLTSRAFSTMAHLPALRTIVIFGNHAPRSHVGSHALPPDWDALAGLQHLENVSLTNIGLRPDQLRGVESLESLRSLNVSISEFNDPVVESLCRIPDLEYLQLSCVRISGRGLAGLRDAEKLKKVRITCRGNISLSDVAFLLEYTDPEVRTVSFNTPLSLSELADALPGAVRGFMAQGRDIRYGERAPYRMTINAQGRSVQTERNLTDEDMATIARLRDLESLSLTRHPDTDDALAVTRDGLRHLRSLPKLRRVTLGLGAPFSGTSLDVLGTLPSLDHLELHDVAVDAEGLRWLKSAEALRFLDIDRGLIDGDALRSLHLAGSLIRFSLKDVRLASPRLQHLANAPIEELTLEQCRVGDADCLDIGKCTALNRLNIDGGAITDRGIAHLDALHHLKSLRLKTEGHVTLAGLRQLGSLARLRYVDAVGQGNKRLMDQGMAQELGWTFQGQCSCGCMDYTRPRVCRVTKDEIRDGVVVIDPENPDLKHWATAGLRIRGPLELERLTLRGSDFPFPMRQLHFNDCHIKEVIMIGIDNAKISFICNILATRQIRDYSSNRVNRPPRDAPPSEQQGQQREA